MNRARRLLCGLAAPALLATGCLIPYAYPKLDYVPACDVGPASDVHAFRVDVSARQIDIGETGSFTLTEIEPRADGSFPPQVGASVERGYLVLGIAINYNVGRLHATRVRLYRPGHLLVELPAWGSARDVVWTAAPDWAAQEKAIDDLLQRPPVSVSAAHFVKSQGSFWGPENQPRDIGSKTPLPQPYLFAAAEYERVAKLAPAETDAYRLREKAKRLRERKLPISTGSAARVNDAPMPRTP